MGKLWRRTEDNLSCLKIKSDTGKPNLYTHAKVKLNQAKAQKTKASQK